MVSVLIILFKSHIGLVCYNIKYSLMRFSKNLIINIISEILLLILVGVFKAFPTTELYKFMEADPPSFAREINIRKPLVLNNP